LADTFPPNIETFRLVLALSEVDMKKLVYLNFQAFSFRLSISPLVGIAVLWLMRFTHSFYEELIAALLIGMFCGCAWGWRSMVWGGVFGGGAWTIGLLLSGFIEARIGIAFGTWFTAAVALSCIPFVFLLRVRRSVRAVGMLLLGIIIGLTLETLTLMPSFLYAFRFADSQALTVLGAALLMIPLLGLGAGAERKAGRL